MHRRQKDLLGNAIVAVFESFERRMLFAVGVLDQIIFGNTSSETTHAFNSVSTQVISGNLGQPARRELPLSPNQVNGGSMTFTLAVDPVKRNYFSIKLWGGDDTSESIGRLYLYIPINGTDYQVGYRHEGDYEPLSVAADDPPLPGRFFYSTTLLPLSMTQGKTSLALKIQSTGELYGLGSGGPPSGNYQFNMTTASRGIYRAYTHTDAMLDVSDETQGTAPASTTRPSPTESSVLGPTGTYTVGLNGWINGRLSAATNAFTATDVELLARSYTTAGLSTASPSLVGYHNSAVVSKLIAVIDGFATDYYASPYVSPTSTGNAVTGADNYGGAGGNEVWGGRFGALGWAVHLLSAAGQLPANVLDATASYGAGGTVTRRQAWGTMLLGSRDYGRYSRDSRYLTNQTLIADTNIYQANRGLEDLGNPNAFTEPQAERYLKEAIGLLPWTGSDLLGGGSSYKYGKDYYQVTPDGLTKEWGYPGGYGEMQYFAATFYEYTGDSAFRDQAIKIAKARAYFRRPALEQSGSSYYNEMQREGILAWRGVREADGYFSNEVSYADTSTFSLGMHTAGVTLDPTIVGYAKQMLNDNEYFNQLIADPRYYSTLTFDSRFAFEVYDDYNAVKNAADSGARLPMTAGQPDSAFADDQDDIVAIKHGTDELWIESLWQAKDGTGINGIGRFDYSTPTYEQYGDIETSPQFDFSGSYYVRPNLIDKPEPDVTQYTPSPAPSNAYAGEILPIGNEVDAHDDQPFRGRASFYAMRFGHYLIGINSTSDRAYQLSTPSDFTSAVDLISGANQSGAVMVSPSSTVALYLGSATDPAPVPRAPLYVGASGSPTQVNLTWSAASGATSYNVERALSPTGPYTTIATAINLTSYADINITRGTTYYYVVTGVNANGQSDPSGDTMMSAGLPGPWSNQDIGTVSLPGTASVKPGGFLLTATGTSIGGTADSFQFAYLPITGDTTIIAQVSMMNTSGQDRAGIMMRESLDSGSKFATILLEDGGNLRLTRRTTTGGTAATSGAINGTFFAPGWIKLERIGNTFNAYTSTDGVNWGSPFSSQTFSMNSTLYVGLAATSRTQTLSIPYNQTIAANFDHVQILPGVTVTGASYPINQRPDILKFTFSADVGATIAASDLVLTRSDGEAVPAVQSVQWDSSTKTATFFLSPGEPASGVYHATLPAYSVNTASGQTLNVDFTFLYSFLPGDANSDGIVNMADFNLLASHFNQSGQTWSTGDFNYDNVVNLLDLNALATNFGATASAAIPQSESVSVASIGTSLSQVASSTTNRFSQTPIETVESHIWDDISLTYNDQQLLNGEWQQPNDKGYEMEII
ncbi:MAG TPA: dockerin type I domain-containing protein [Tepidisphaeraceae bacterium]|jgi:hypothetical protein|nr:dockerin type I domain-containing protein [Tepidisphaeraceae bacterium]